MKSNRGAGPVCEFGVVIMTPNSPTPDRFQAWQSCRWAAAPDVTTQRRHDAGTATQRKPDRDYEVVRKSLFRFLWNRRCRHPIGFPNNFTKYVTLEPVSRRGLDQRATSRRRPARPQDTSIPIELYR